MPRSRRRNAAGNRSGNSGTKPISQPGVRQYVAPPPVPDGRTRCPVCRNHTGRTPSGYLRKHRDVFGHPCYNRRPEPLSVDA
jgi:hypothetical protein